MLHVSGITKRFPGVLSLDAVDFDVQPGEIHALVGENGAGKSTLVKVIAGAHAPDQGTIRFDGRAVAWANPHQARAAGIHVIYQDLVLFPELSVAENVFIGQEPRNRWGLIDTARMHRRAREVLAELGVEIDARARVKRLSVADQQMVEIAKALIGDTKLLILDEPTAVISGREADLLFARMRALRARGVAIVYISHRLDEIFAIADRVTVLKDGRLAGTLPIGSIDRARLIALMVGRPLTDIYPPKPAAIARQAPVLEADGLSAGERVRGVGFALYPGEVLGIAGLVGAGRSELAHALFGSVPVRKGRMRLAGEPYAPRSPAEAIARGVGLLTEDRKAEGLLLNLELAPNITAPRLDQITVRGLLDLSRELAIAGEEIAKYAIAAPSARARMVNLSGGNQQKALFSRWVRACHKVLILDEPTRGVDVGAKVEIYHIIRRLAASGVGVIMISSELLEILGLCDRILVMREGRISGELAANQASEEGIMALASLHPGAAVETAA